MDTSMIRRPSFTVLSTKFLNVGSAFVSRGIKYVCEGTAARPVQATECLHFSCHTMRLVLQRTSRSTRKFKVSSFGIYCKLILQIYIAVQNFLASVTTWLN